VLGANLVVRDDLVELAARLLRGSLDEQVLESLDVFGEKSCGPVAQGEYRDSLTPGQVDDVVP